ncbi:MAG TPA: hypothetical protein VKU61_11050 [Candidatus Binatia bacterium]|nr:hypothetical protein [Candidatus Binatia bacterium]
MIVRVRGIEIVCESLEELDQLMERYGEAAATNGAASMSVGGSLSTHAGKKAVALDNGLLQAFAQSPTGVQSKIVEGMLGIRGKAIRAALRAWATRVHLSPDTIEKANPGGRRGWKLTSSGIAAAKALMMTGQS